MALPWVDALSQRTSQVQASEMAMKLRNGPYDDASFLRKDGSAEKLVLNTFTGADISCHLLMPDPPNKAQVLNAYGIDEKDYDFPALKLFAELQTLTISSARSVFGVRRLGEHHVHKYTRGGRTIAGTMVMTTFSRDVFAEFYRLHGGDNFTDPNAPFFVDQIPPFHLMIMGENEYGVRANAALINCTLTNFGTTLSVHDLQIEATYSYVAQFFFPFVQDYRAFQKLVGIGSSSFIRPLSEGLISRGLLYNGTQVVAPGEMDIGGTSPGELEQVDRSIESVYQFLEQGETP